VIPLARRYAVAGLALMVLAAVPVWLHGATGMTADPCARPEALERLRAFGVAPVSKHDAIHANQVLSLWVEAKLEPLAPRKLPPWGRLVRHSDPFVFYGRLDRFAFSPLLPKDRTSTRRLAVGSDELIVHERVDTTTGVQRLLLYFFAQGMRPISHPFTGGISSALSQVLHGTEPITLVVVSGIADDESRAAFDQRADAWLAQVWTEYREACRP
jgi:hypothetical protein